MDDLIKEYRKAKKAKKLAKANYKSLEKQYISYMYENLWKGIKPLFEQNIELEWFTFSQAIEYNDEFYEFDVNIDDSQLVLSISGEEVADYDYGTVRQANNSELELLKSISDNLNDLDTKAYKKLFGVNVSVKIYRDGKIEIADYNP